MNNDDREKDIGIMQSDSDEYAINPPSFSPPDSPRSYSFLTSLYREKEIHKEHRHKHVIQKLLLTSLFFGFGQLVKDNSLIFLLLYAVPLIAVVHDVYIFAEHDKIRRVGDFIKVLGRERNTSICPEEISWEEYATNHREKRALIGSLAYTLIISAFSAAAILKLNPSEKYDWFFQAWGIVVVLAIIAVFVKGYFEIKFQIKRRNEN